MMENYENSSYLGYDELFSVPSTGLKWMPWVGQQYAGLLQDQKLLIVGESHYKPEGEDDDDYEEKGWTREFIQKEGLKHPDYYYGAPTNRLIGNTEKVISGNEDPSDAEKVRFWHSVAYYNFIQRLLGSIGPEDRPVYDDWQTGWSTFFSVVRILRPRYVLFCGLEASNQFAELDDYHDDKNWNLESFKVQKADNPIGSSYPRTLELTYPDGGPLKILFVRHPSRYFSWRRWFEKFVEPELRDYVSWQNSLATK